MNQEMVKVTIDGKEHEYAIAVSYTHLTLPTMRNV